MISRRMTLDEQKDKTGQAERCEKGQAERRARTSRKTRQGKQKDETGHAERLDRRNRKTRQDMQKD